MQRLLSSTKQEASCLWRDLAQMPKVGNDWTKSHVINWPPHMPPQDAGPHSNAPFLVRIGGIYE